MKSVLIVLCLITAGAHADIGQEFEGLGGNRVLLDKAKELNPEKEVSIVQERVVSRRNRVELAPEFLGSFGGDTYSRTSGLGLNVHYHITPRWSLGARYAYNFNSLTPEGKAAVDRAEEDFRHNPTSPTAAVPTLDYPRSEMFASLYWYPIYGKMNLLDKGIAHFDLYALAGYGRVSLSSGSVPSYTAGGGFGFWWTQHFASRVEMRYQTYTAKYFDTSTKLDLAIASLQLGWLL
jgi:outer membrane beta-barrel protein